MVVHILDEWRLRVATGFSLAHEVDNVNVGGRWPCNLKKGVCINVRAAWLDWHLVSLSTPGQNYHAQLSSCNTCIGGNSRRGLSSEYCSGSGCGSGFPFGASAVLARRGLGFLELPGSTSSIDECTSSFHHSNPK